MRDSAAESSGTELRELFAHDRQSLRAASQSRVAWIDPLTTLGGGLAAQESDLEDEAGLFGLDLVVHEGSFEVAGRIGMYIRYSMPQWSMNTVPSPDLSTSQ
jgi:hypothetical protein